MILQDVSCSICGLCEERILESNNDLSIYCSICKKTTEHKILCTGGCKSRYRFNDWDGVDFTGSVKVSEPEAYHEIDGKETPCIDKHGKKIQDKEKFKKDKLDEKHDKIKTKFKRNKGKVPLFIDQKPTTSGR